MTPIKTTPKVAADSDRNADGLPKDLEPETEWPTNWAQINGGGSGQPGSGPLTANIDQRNSGNRNDHLPYLIGISIMATAAFVMCVLGYIYGPRLIGAELRAEFAQEIADAKADSRQAGTIAQLYKNRVDKLEAEANADRRRGR